MSYLNVTEIDSALAALTAAYPSLCRLITLPHETYEHRTCYAVHLGTATPSTRDAILIVGGLHAREWGSADIAINFAADLLEAYTAGTGLSYGGRSYTPAEVRTLIEDLDLIVFPCVNPDGRHYSQNVDPGWRRNRNPAESGGAPECVGVDLNRNYDFLWDHVSFYAPGCGIRTSADPCNSSQIYRGSAAASEPETKNCVWLIETYPRIRWMMDLHSFSELILYPWGDDENQTTDPSMNFSNPAYNSVRGLRWDTDYQEFIPPSDLAVFQSMAERIHAAIQEVRGTTYRCQQSFALYPTSGTTGDYAYSRHFRDSARPKIGGFCLEWGTVFQPPWAEMERIILDVSAGLVEFCLAGRSEGGLTEIEPANASLVFLDVPEGETTSRAAVFRVRSSRAVSLQITAGPGVITGPPGTHFGTPLGTVVTLPPVPAPAPERMARVWVSYTGTQAGDIASGEVTIHCPETRGEWTLPITANTIARPTVAVTLVLDASNSMNWLSGLPEPLETRVKTLRFAAVPLAEIIPEGNALGIVRFDEDAHPVMSPTPVGPLETGAGRLAARGHLEGHTPNPAGWTSIGDGLVLAHDMVAPVTGYDLKATIVLTDGHENRPEYIDDVASLINERVYAIGLGTAEVIRPGALLSLTAGTGGYLLLTGALSDDNTFLLSKYYLQILAGVTNAEIVLDPDGWLRPGEVRRIPFRLGESDYGSDVILLAPGCEVFRFSLETPGGDAIDPGHAAAGSGVRYVKGKGTSFYRLTLPAAVAGREAHGGVWHAVLKLDDVLFGRYVETHQKRSPKLAREAMAHGLRYNVSAQALSNLKMSAAVAQSGCEPGAVMTLRAVFTEAGLPLAGRARAEAEVERPDGTRAAVYLGEIEPGVLEALLPAPLAGVYRLRVLGSGYSLRGTPFTRERLLTGFVYKGGDRYPPRGGGCRDLDIEAIRACLAEFQGRPPKQALERGSPTRTAKVTRTK